VRLRRVISTATLLAGCALALAGCAAPRPPGPLLSAPPSAAADDDVYVSDAEGRIRALRPDGTEQWVFSLPEEVMRVDKTASRFIRVDYLSARSGGKLFGLATEEAGRYAGRTFIFAMVGNRLLWHVETPFPGQGGAPLAVGQTAVYQAGNDGALYAFSRTDGHQLWKYQVSRGALGSPTEGADGTVYVTGPRHNLHAVSPEGTQRWVVETQN
jgi:outer membrane protein assembly factor BamB